MTISHMEIFILIEVMARGKIDVKNLYLRFQVSLEFSFYENIIGHRTQRHVYVPELE